MLFSYKKYRTTPAEYNDLCGLYAYKGRVPEATTADYKTYLKIKATGVHGTVRVPALPIDTAELSIDDAHILERNHGVNLGDAIKFIEKADYSLSRKHWREGEYINYYSKDGASYVLKSKNLIRTAFKRAEFKNKIKTIAEILEGN